MSITSMSEAKLIRQRLHQRDANVVERALGLKRLVERKQPTPEDMVKATGAPDGVLARLVRWIPTEMVTLYVAFIALYGPLMPTEGSMELQTATGFTGRWLGFGAFAAVTVPVVVLIHLSKLRRTAEPFRWPWFEMVVAPVAFAAWALSLPDTPLNQISDYNPAIGGFILLASTVAIGLVAEAFGKQPGPPAPRADGGDEVGEPRS